MFDVGEVGIKVVQPQKVPALGTGPHELQSASGHTGLEMSSV
jgi:hypothetical protein